MAEEWMGAMLSLDDKGLVWGAEVILPAAPDGRIILEGQETRVQALLSAIAGEAAPDTVLAGLGKALAEWNKHQRARALTRLVRLTGFLPTDRAAFERLRQALDEGDAPESVMRFEDKGLVWGAEVILPAAPDGRIILEGQETRVLALLSAIAGEAAPDTLLAGLGKALAEWNKHQRARALTRLVRLTGFLPTDRAAFERLRRALDEGDAPEAAARDIEGLAVRPIRTSKTSSGTPLKTPAKRRKAMTALSLAQPEPLSPPAAAPDKGGLFLPALRLKLAEKVESSPAPASLYDYHGRDERLGTLGRYQLTDRRLTEMRLKSRAGNGAWDTEFGRAFGIGKDSDFLASPAAQEEAITRLFREMAPGVDTLFRRFGGRQYVGVAGLTIEITRAGLMLALCRESQGQVENYLVRLPDWGTHGHQHDSHFALIEKSLLEGQSLPYGE